MSVKIKLDTSVLDRMIAQVPGNAERVTAEAALSIEAETKKNIRGWGLIDTSALLNSIKAEKKGSAFWEVHDGVEYGVYWELGHKNIFLHRYVRKPFMGPAVAYVAAKFMQNIAKGIIK
jgi:hypothetical protein